MLEEIKTCVSARTDFFGKYTVVPAELQGEVDAFVAAVVALGEASSDVASFESAFASGGLSDQFNSLVTRCTPKAYEMTDADKEYSRQVAAEMYSKDDLVQDVTDDLIDSAKMQAESDLHALGRRAMSEAGILDDVTKATNLVEDVGLISGFFKKKFGKK